MNAFGNIPPEEIPLVIMSLTGGELPAMVVKWIA